MKTQRIVREDEEQRKRIALNLGYVGEPCCVCNEYTLGKEVTDEVDPVSPLICQTCGNRQLPIRADFDDSVHTIVPLPDGIQGLDLPVPEREDTLQRQLREWLRSHIFAAKAGMVILATLCSLATVIFAWRVALHFAENNAADLDLMLCGLAGMVVFFGLWYMLEVAGDHLQLNA